MDQAESVLVGKTPRNNTKVKCSILLAAVAIGALSIASAGAAQQPDPNSTSVHFGDLNIHTPEGIATLFRRIRRAAQAVCGPYEIRDLMQASGARICFDDAVANAVKSVNMPSLTAYANTQRGHASQIVVATRSK